MCTFQPKEASVGAGWLLERGGSAPYGKCASFPPCLSVCSQTERLCSQLGEGMLMKHELAALSGSSRAICHQLACLPAPFFPSFGICMLSAWLWMTVGFSLMQRDLKQAGWGLKFSFPRLRCTRRHRGGIDRDLGVPGDPS